MMKQTFETSATVQITVTKCAGDLVVRGTREQQIVLLARGDTDDPVMTQEGDAFTLSSWSHCILECPAGTELSVRSTMRDVMVSNLDGKVTLDKVAGRVVMYNVGPVWLDRVGGSADIRDVAGDLTGKRVMGSLRVHRIQGLLSVKKVYGSLRANGIENGLQVDRVMGSARIGPPYTPNADYRLRADGSLRVYVPQDGNIRLSLKSAGRIRSRLPGLILQSGAGEVTGVLGDGEATLEARALGSIRLLPYKPSEPMFDSCVLDGLGGRVEWRIAEVMADMETCLDDWEHGCDWHRGGWHVAHRPTAAVISDLERLARHEITAEEALRLLRQE